MPSPFTPIELPVILDSEFPRQEVGTFSGLVTEHIQYLRQVDRRILIGTSPNWTDFDPITLTSRRIEAFVQFSRQALMEIGPDLTIPIIQSASKSVAQAIYDDGLPAFTITDVQTERLGLLDLESVKNRYPGLQRAEGIETIRFVVTVWGPAKEASDA